VAIVLTAELFNTAVEWLAKAVTRTEDPHIEAALDIASGAVLLAAAGAAIVGLLIFLPRVAGWNP
jgi:diacylglycerol kinase